jgi:hypothetical protein
VICGSVRGEADNIYKVCIENVYKGVEVSRGFTRKGRLCRKYVISVDNGD